MKIKFVFALLAAALLTLGGCSDSNDTAETPTNPEQPGTDPSAPDDPADVPDDTPDAVKFKTFKGLVMCGYQGWFNTPGDGAGKGYVHWSDNIGKFETGHSSVDYYPDMREYTKTYPADFVNPDGTQATIFSSYDYETVDLHFKWMKQYGIDGAIIQRFKSATEAADREPAIKVIENCVKASIKYGVAIMLEYDFSGLGENDDMQRLAADWNELNERFGFSDPSRCPTYVWQDGKPLVGFYGIGMSKYDTTEGYEKKTDKPEQYLELFDSMVGRDGKKGNVSIFAGTGYFWRTGKGDGSNDGKKFEDWEPIYKRCSVISPWAVGRYSNIKGAEDRARNVALPDSKWCKENKVLYAPVSFPGFSWRNMHVTYDRNNPDAAPEVSATDPYDPCPRLGGQFLWYQFSNYIEFGIADALFVAMFDEVDEGTAVFKCTNNKNTPLNSTELYPEGKFLGYDDNMDTGYYMFLCGEAHKWLNNPQLVYYRTDLPSFVAPAPIE